MNNLQKEDIMKKLLVATTAIALMASSVYATNSDQDNVLGHNYQQSGSHAVGGDNVTGGQGNTTVTHEQGSHNTTVTNKTVTHKPNGYVSNPNLTTSGLDTCFGSKSGGISGPGFGISGGETVIDENCIMIKQAKILASLGLKDAAVLLLMNSDEDIARAIWGANPDLADHLTSIKEQ